MHKQRTAVISLSLIGMLATFLPWVTVPIFGAINGTKGDGWISFAFFAIVLLVALSGERAKQFDVRRIIATSLWSLLAAALGIWKMMSFNDVIEKASQDAGPLADSFSIGLGLYLVVGAGVLLPIIVIVLKDRSTSPEPEPVEAENEDSEELSQ